MRWWICVAAIAMTCLAVQATHVSTTEVSMGHWRTLSEPHMIGQGAIYYHFDLPNGSRAHLVVVDLRSGKWTIRPAISEPATQPTSVQAREQHASAATNGGYFNLKDGGHSTSYVVINGKTVADPTCNTALTENPKLKPFLARILNRSEVRFLRGKDGKSSIEVVRHSTPLPSGTELIHSLQAGPQLLPTNEAIDEAFIRTNPDGTDADSISARKPKARTAFGITSDGYALMLCVAGAGQDPESSGLTLDELASLMRKLGCVQALNLDGGASTTMFVNDQVVCGKNPETLVKSILLLEPN